VKFGKINTVAVTCMDSNSSRFLST
jgi:hypothetical protein